MKTRESIEPNSGILTNQMDVETKEFNEFQAILLNKSKKRSENQKLVIELISLRFQMEDYLKSEDQEVRKAGEFLKLYLKTLQIQQNVFAKYIGLNPSNLSKLISGERPINHELALIFGKIFNVNPMLWLEIQAKNELRKLRRTSNNKFKKYSLNDLINAE